MKKHILMASVVVITFGIISESWAATCTWDGTKLTVTGSGTFTGCDDNSNHKLATEVTFGEGITSIDNGAFSEATSLKSVDMPNVTTIGQGAFYKTSLTDVDMPKVTTIGWYAFNSSSSLIYAGFSSNNVSIGNNAFWGTGISSCDSGANCNSCTNGVVMPGKGCIAACDAGYTVNTQGLCKKKPAQSTQPTSVTPEEETPQQVTAASCAADGKVLQGKECVSSCGASFKLNDGECDRIRYTPAEAAQYLKDTDNTIIMTFKVNR